MLDKADHIITIADGKIVHSGSSKELIEKGVDFAAFLRDENDIEAGKKLVIKNIKLLSNVV